MTRLLGVDLQSTNGDLSKAPRTLEQYPANVDLNDTLTDLFPSGLSTKIRCGGAGNLKVLLRNGDSSLIESVLAGETVEIECVKVIKTGTTATKITVFF